MKIFNYQKNSFIDFPGVISCVIFTPFCNFNCWYCHNAHVIYENKEMVSEEEVLEFLEERIGFLDGVVISGGEPTFQSDLIEFIEKVKKMGFKVKLDTNGSRPHIVKKIVDKKLVDFIAMDIKAPLNVYRKIVNCDVDVKNIKESIRILKGGEIPCEFRTTFSPDLTKEEIVAIAKLVGKKHNYAIQQYIKLYEGFKTPHSEEFIKETADEARKFVKNLTLRGLKTEK